jgi:hypothetical protein
MSQVGLVGPVGQVGKPFPYPTNPIHATDPTSERQP